MANHVINVNPFNPLSIARAERLYNRYLQEFQIKVDQFISEIAELGSVAADTGYGGQVGVTVEPINNGYAIIASGSQVVFLEFGAGDTVNTGNRYASVMPFEVSSGSWSVAHNGEYSIRQRVFGQGWWYYGGIKYTQITPCNAMQSAYDEIMSNWRDIAERVFA